MEASSQHLLSSDYTELYRRIPLMIQFGYGVGHVLNDICASMWFTYLLVYFHLVLEFSNSEAGLVLLVGQVADALSTPFVGFHSDNAGNMWLCRYGKRKTWHLLGTICVVLSFPFIFSPCVNCSNSSKWAQLFYYCVFVCIFQFGWASVQISHLSLIPEITPNEHDRTQLTAIRYSFTVVSNLLVYIVTWTILKLDSASENSKIGPSDASKFTTVILIGLVVGIICSVVFHCIVKENSNTSGQNVRGGQLRSTVRDLLCTPQIYQVAVVYMSTRLFVNLSQVFIPLYLHETLNMTASTLALIPLIMFIGSFLTSLLTEKLNRRCGRKVAYICGSLIGLTACIWIQFDYTGTFVKREIYVVAFLIGSGGSVILVTSLGITADLIGDKTGSGAFVYGLMSFTDKLANGLFVVLIQYYHGYDLQIPYYRNVLTYCCGGAAILGILSVMSLIGSLRREPRNYNLVPDYNSINTETTRNVPGEQAPVLIA